MTISIKQIFVLFLTLPLFGQVQQEVNPPDHIKTIIFKGSTDDQFPVVQLGEPIFLEFDDMRATEEDYYYRIVHYDYDWTPSELLKSQYLDGVDNQRIIQYENSYSTLLSYSHYSLRIPNINVRPKVSGNYAIEIYNSFNELMFSRRFVVYQNLVGVGVSLKRSRDFDVFNAEQLVQISISTRNFQVVNHYRKDRYSLGQCGIDQILQ